METRPLAPVPSLFGSPTRTAVLSVLAMVGNAHVRELSRLTGYSLSSVQAAIRGLEREGAVATRRLGSERRIELSPRYFAYRELRELLLKLYRAQPQLVENVRAARRRPRRIGKPETFETA